VRQLADRVLQLAEAVDLDPDHVATLQEPRRVEPDADADRRARRDDLVGRGDPGAVTEWEQRQYFRLF